MERTQTTTDATRMAPKIDIPAKIVDNSDFTMKLVVPKQWRLSMGISHDDVWRVGLRAVATFESSLPVVAAVAVCEKCAKKRTKFLDVAVSSRDVFGPTLVGPDVECFSFDRCRAHCSSSRLHMRSRLVIAMQFNDYTTVFSDAFVTTARAGRGAKPYDSPRARCAATPPSNLSSSAQLLIPPSQAPTPKTISPVKEMQKPLCASSSGSNGNSSSNSPPVQLTHSAVPNVPLLPPAASLLAAAQIHSSPVSMAMRQPQLGGMFATRSPMGMCGPLPMIGMGGAMGSISCLPSQMQQVMQMQMHLQQPQQQQQQPQQIAQQQPAGN